jgi:hypothetical protein
MLKKLSLSIVTVHPDSAKVPLIRDSVAENAGTSDIELIPVVGEKSIARAYNRGYSQARGTHVLFVHSDVEVLTSKGMLWGAMHNCDQQAVGILGIAGSNLLDDDPVWWANRERSGACLHVDGEKTWMTEFGPYGRVIVLDGVFLMMRTELLRMIGGFDESFPGWDFYDIDISLRSHLAGYINMTYPLHILHHSVGDVKEKKGWHDNKARFVEKWKDVLPINQEGAALLAREGPA